MGQGCSYLRHLSYVLGVSGADSRSGVSQLAAGERHCNHTLSLQYNFLCKDKPQMLVYTVACWCASKRFLTVARRHFGGQAAEEDALPETAAAFKIDSTD